MPTREEMIAALRGGGQKPSREEMIAALRGEQSGVLPVGAGTNISPEQRAKNAQSPFGFLENIDPLGAGLRVLDYPSGLVRTGAATLGGMLKGDVQSVVSDEDAKQALLGNAPTSDEYYGRLGMPEGKFRTGLGFTTDVLSGSPRGLINAASKAESALSKTAGRFGKPTAEEIEKAATALNVKPTKGMMTDDYLVRNLENSLSQSPSLPGAMVRKDITPILNVADDATKEALEGASVQSELQTGKNIKAGLKGHFEKKLEPLEKSYEEIATHTKNIPFSEKRIIDGLGRISKNIKNIEGAEFKGSDAERVASQFAGWVEEAKSVDALKRLRTKALERARDATKSAEERHAASLVAEKLSQAQSNTITRQSIAIAKQSPFTTTSKGKALNSAQKKVAAQEAEAEGVDIGRRLIGDIKQTNKGYRSLMDEARTFGKGSGLTKAKAGARGVIDDIENANPQDMASALFDSGNLEFTQFVKKTMPEQFELAKSHRLQEISRQVGGDPKKLTKLISKMEPEEKMLLFGNEAAGRLDNVSTLLRALPEKVGSSDTPRGLMFRDLLSPTQNINDLGRYGLLKGAGLISPTTRKVAPVVLKGAAKQGLIHSGRK